MWQQSQFLRSQYPSDKILLRFVVIIVSARVLLLMAGAFTSVILGLPDIISKSYSLTQLRMNRQEHPDNLTETTRCFTLTSCF